MKKVDMVGKRFGRWTVLEESKEKNEYGELLFLCKCDCGKIKILRGKDLRKGSTKSCGCSRNKILDEKIINKKVNRLTIVKDTQIRQSGHVMVECKCDCGNIKILSLSDVLNNKVKSCGCLNKENGYNKCFKHGYKKTRLYHVWTDMKSRCYCKTKSNYKNYGAKGIKVCNEWLNDFVAFHDWAYNNGYDEKVERGKCTIDRINYNGNYEPSNCRWITIQEQQRNKRNNHFITINGITKTLCEWAKISGVNHSTISSRIKRGIKGNDLIKPVKKR